VGVLVEALLAAGHPSVVDHEGGLHEEEALSHSLLNFLKVIFIYFLFFCVISVHNS